MRRLGLAAVAARDSGERDARTEKAIIVHVDIVRHAEFVAEAKEGRIVAKQVMHRDARGPLGLQQAEQGRQLTRNGEAEVRERVFSAVIDGDRLAPA